MAVRPERLGAAGGRETHLAGVPLAIPGTQHVVPDDRDVVPCVQASVVFHVTDAVFYNGDLHLPQGKWWWQGFWG